MYMANRAGRSVVTSVAATVGAVEATQARAAVTREDRRSLILLGIGVRCVVGGLTLEVQMPLYISAEDDPEVL